jgi:hypothetical protein
MLKKNSIKNVGHVEKKKMHFKNQIQNIHGVARAFISQ